MIPQIVVSTPYNNRFTPRGQYGKMTVNSVYALAQLPYFGAFRLYLIFSHALMHQDGDHAYYDRHQYQVSKEDFMLKIHLRIVN